MGVTTSASAKNWFTTDELLTLWDFERDALRVETIPTFAEIEEVEQRKERDQRRQDVKSQRGGPVTDSPAPIVDAKISRTARRRAGPSATRWR